ncbi:MAG: TIGR03936 family radical SAM-associated protein, partial [Acidobacteria bacterium]|nr:TIGR03936 family radical SAM-associated protein [Acidobacteriota bacterium]
TFAPEAGSQRMRDVVNKNVSEQDIYETCRRVFSRGWDRAKLYFMIGLPTEEDEDVLGIADMGRQARHIGDREAKRRVRITVAVSSHVPKPHTPFQWCAQDSMADIERKQELLHERARQDGFRLRTHDRRVSHLEGILSRGDIRTARLVEIAFRLGARFDGWDEQLRWELWEEAFERWESETGATRGDYLGTIPVDGRLPWEHVDVGLADGFLLREYRRALKDRASPPCGKPVSMQVHHTNLADARADRRKLVCYHCGVACDLDGMRTERIEFLESMGAEEPRSASETLLPVVAAAAPPASTAGHRRPAPPVRAFQGDPVVYRARFDKFGPMALRGHGELIRILPRVLRRAGLPIRFSEGFSPRPKLSFGPALPLGVQSLGEFCEFALTEELPEVQVLAALRGASEEGLRFTELVRVHPGEPKLSRWIAALRYAVLLAADLEPASVEARLEAFRAADSWPIELTRRVKQKSRRRGPRAPAGPRERTVEVDLRDFVECVHLAPAGSEAAFLGCSADRLTLRFRTVLTGTGSAPRPGEITRALAGFEPVATEIVRTAGEPSTLPSARAAEEIARPPAAIPA